MRFQDPLLLWLLLLAPLLAISGLRRASPPSLLFPSAELVRGPAARRGSRATRLRGVLRVGALALLVIAIARPQRGLGAEDVEASGIDIVLALDVSGSMRALDFELEGKPANRLDVVKAVVRRFIEARPSDRIGLVAFAGRPYVVSPLTLDHDWLIQNLERVHIGLVEDGTAIGSGIATTVNRLRDQPARSKIGILLTDGVNNAGKVAPLTAADAARALGIKVYTIGAGTRGEAPIPVTDNFGRERIVMAQVDVDEDTLRRVAETTGAEFFRATDTDSLAKIYATIDRLEKTTAALKKFEQYRDLYAWPLSAGLLLLLAELVLAETRLRRLP